MTRDRNCQRCGGEMLIRKATMEEPYLYSASGLDNVFLCGIEVRWCKRCRSESPIIPKFDQLHDLLARNVLRKPARLAGKEIRFIRKHVGLAAKKFAARLGVSLIATRPMTRVAGNPSASRADSAERPSSRSQRASISTAITTESPETR